MNGSSTRIFQNVRYDLVLNDDNPNDYYFEPTGDVKDLKKKMLPAGNNENNAEGGKVKEYKEDKNKEAKEKKESAEFDKTLKEKLSQENKEQGRTLRQKLKKGLTSVKKGAKAVGKSYKEGKKKVKAEISGSAKDQKAITYKPQLEEFEKILSDKKYPRPAKAMKQMSKLLKRGWLGTNPAMKWPAIKEEIKDMDAKQLEIYLSKKDSFLGRRIRQAKATGGAGDKAVKNLFSGSYNAVKGAGKAANEYTKKGSIGIVRSGIGAAGSKAFKGGKAIGRYAKGITTAQNNYNNVNRKSKHVSDLQRIEEFDKKKLKEKVKEIKMLEKIIFKLSGQPSATRKRLNKLAKNAGKGLKFAGKGLFKLGKKGIGFLKKLPGGKVGVGSSSRSIGKGFKMGSEGARATARRLKKFGGAASQGARNIGRKFRGIGKSGAKLALKGVKAASRAAERTARAIAEKTKTPVNDQPGLVCWNFTNLPPCLMCKCIAPCLTCSFDTEKKAREQAKRLKN